jgi:hypothetical protein
MRRRSLISDCKHKHTLARVRSNGGVRLDQRARRAHHVGHRAKVLDRAEQTGRALHKLVEIGGETTRGQRHEYARSVLRINERKEGEQSALCRGLEQVHRVKAGLKASSVLNFGRISTIMLFKRTP